MTELAVDPDRDTFLERAAGERPVVNRIQVDLDVSVSPLAAYATLAGRSSDERDPAPYAFLLESAEKLASSDPDGAFAPVREERHARYSFAGDDPVAIVTVDAQLAARVEDCTCDIVKFTAYYRVRRV